MATTIFSCGFESGKSLGDWKQISESAKTASLIVSRHAPDGIYNYEYVEGNKLRVKRKYKNAKGKWVTKTRILSPGQTAWGWQWNGVPHG